MPTFTQIKANIRENLNDANVTFWSADDLDASVQDAYDDVVARTRCITKRVTLSWVANEIYPDFSISPYSVTDFLGVVAIKNNVTNRWLEDNISRKQLDQIREDWELLTGATWLWVPAGDNKRTILFPHYASAAGTFDLVYSATAPTVVDGQSPLIPADMHRLIEIYATADLLTQAEEFTVAILQLKEYYSPENGIPAYAKRARNISQSDFMTKM
jgi:hypothetical protein